MAQSLDQIKTKKVHVAEVVRHGEKITIPNDMSIDAAIKTLMEKKQSEEQEIALIEEVDAFVWDGAHAFAQVLDKKYGFFKGITQHTFFGSNPPAMIGIETANGTTVNVPWGQFSVPGITGTFTTQTTEKKGMGIFQLVVRTKKKFEGEVKALVQLIREYVKANSIYKGQAFKMSFLDTEGEIDPYAKPVFLDLSKVDEKQMIFSYSLDSAIRTNLFTPIEQSEGCRKLGIPLKRGVLLAGDYGVGKTLVAYNTAKKARDHGWTYIYCENPKELAAITRFAVRYAPAVVFCEDIDRVMGGDRTISLDENLNVLDGIEAKDKELLVVFTTNQVDKIHQAALRPGRLDAVIAISRPDREAVERLIRLYAGRLISDEVDLSAVGRLLADNIPAVIQECVNRSKLSALRLMKGNVDEIPVDALVEAAETMKMQLDLLNRKPKLPVHPFRMLGAEIGVKIAHAMKTYSTTTSDANGHAELIESEVVE